MNRLIVLVVFASALPSLANGDETFVKIYRVAGNRIAVVRESDGQRQGRGGRGGQANANAQQQPVGGMSRRGRGRFLEQGNATASQTILTVPSEAKITSAMRERRTFEFKVGAELPGGLKNPVFQNLTQPLSARIVTEKNRITQINVITAQTDINQTNTNTGGDTVIAVRPKRPPMKKTAKTSK